MAFDPMTLEQAAGQVGATVRYHPPGVDTTAPTEIGRITSVNDAWVFVVYERGYGAKATRADDLELVLAVEPPADAPPLP
jgi:hypothetical protein